MFRKFYPDAGDHKAVLFSEKVLEHSPKVSAAQIQGYFMFHKDSADSAIENVCVLSTL